MATPASSFATTIPSSTSAPLTPQTTSTPPPPSTSGPNPSSDNTFTFPREYHFPPFFTRQPNLTTRHAQLSKWSALVLAYCAHHRIYKLSLSADLFHNARINRRLSLADAREVFGFMRKEGRAEYVTGREEGFGSSGWTGGGGVGGKDGAGGEVVWVYWKTPEEWAALVGAWVEETAQKGTVLTLYEITDGEGARGTEFFGLDPEILQKALQVLVKRGKAQIFGQEDQQGVKFF
ncbi:ESCRT-II complex, vps25 subunit [Xylariaceae sp. FL0016]|nr:ESCRT-II complex, vps25 subunit [Xylariaceae sp. FL0016]